MNTLNGYSQNSVYSLSGLSTGSYDEVLTNDITANTFEGTIPAQIILYLSGLTGNVQQQINAINTNSGNNTAVTDLQTILTGASWDSVYNFLNLTYNLHVYGTLFLGDPQIDVNYILSNLSSTYATISSLSDYETISDLQTNYVTYTAMIAEFNAQLANYVLYSGLTTTLNNYVSNSSFNNKIK